jgi:hypothetical protein
MGENRPLKKEIPELVLSYLKLFYKHLLQPNRY